jgi:glucans biosynthesis protein C
MRTQTQLTPTIATVRYHGLDAARAIALFIGIFHHGIESFVSYAKWDWITQDSQQSLVLDIFFYVSHVFRMQAFFLMSGFFVHLLLKRLGPWKFVLNRSKRLALPFVIFWPVLFLLTHSLWIWGIQYLHSGTHEQAVSKLPDYMVLSHGLPLMHLWFLYFLILYCGCAVICLPLIKRLINPNGRFVSLTKFLSYCSLKWWGSLLLGSFMIIPMLGMTDGFGVDTSASGLIPRPAPFVLYGMYFALGWIMFRQTELLHNMRQYKRQNLIVSIVLIAVLIGVNLALKGASPLHIILIRALINILYSFASITAVFAFIGYMMTYFSAANSEIRYMSDASYWGYLVHLPLVGYFQILVAQYDLFWPFKLILIFVPVTLILFTSYRYLVRTTAIGALLNGAKIEKGNANLSNGS